MSSQPHASKTWFFDRKHTFIGIELQINIPQMLQYHTDMVEMRFPCDTMDIKVIYKYLKKLLQPFKKMLVIVLENVIVAFFNPNGITSHSCRHVLVMNVVFFTSSRFILIRQKPLYKSKVGKPLWRNHLVQNIVNQWHRVYMFECLMTSSHHKSNCYHPFSNVTLQAYFEKSAIIFPNFTITTSSPPPPPKWTIY